MRTILSSAIACLCVGASLAIVAARLYDGPQLEIERPVARFEHIPRGQHLSHQFALANAGDAPLHIRSVRGSCGCLATIVSNSVIAPHGRGLIEATLTTDTAEEGWNHKSITIESDSAMRRIDLVAIDVQVESELSFSETAIDFGDVRTGEHVTKTITVLASAIRPGIRVTAVSATSPAVHASLRANSPRQWTVIVDYVPNGPIVWDYSVLLISTSSDVMPDMRIPIRSVVDRRH